MADASDRLIAVIDGNSLLHRAFHAMRMDLTSPDGVPTNACYGFMQMLLKMIDLYHPDGIVCAWDVHRPDWRMKLLEQYKAQRPPIDENLAVQFPLIQDLLESMDIPCISMEGYEGDDILGTLAARGEEEGLHTYLITGDRDTYQLVTEDTSVVTTKKGMSDVVIYTPDAVFERYGVTPEQVPDYLGLKGDTSDNIPGVPGIGEKTAARLLGEYGSLEGVIEHADEISGKLGENIRGHIEDARISREVATIRRDAPVDLDLDALHFPDYTAASVKEAFGKLRFVRQLDEVLALIDEDGDDAADDGGTKLDYELSEDADAFFERALSADAWVSVALDEPAELSLFDDESFVVFATDDAAVRLSLEQSTGHLHDLVERGRIVARDYKQILRAITDRTDSAETTEELIACHHRRVEQDGAELADVLFDCTVAAYLLDSSRTSGAYDELVSDYLQVQPPSGEDAPSHGVFEAVSLAALHPVLRDALEKDDTLSCFTQIETPLILVLASMEAVGVKVDTDFLKQMSAELGAQIDALHDEIISLAGEDFNLDSPQQLSHILFDVLGLDTKKSKKTQRGWSTNARVLEKLAEDHPLPARLMEYRELSKLRSTYLDTLPEMVSPRDGRVHTVFNQTVAATGRLSSSDPNLQNIPVRTDLGRRIREAFVAPEGGVFLSADYSQIELRLLAHLSADEHMIAAFESGEDFHTQTAARVFGIPVEEVTPQMRSRAKAVNFGIIYGQQAFGLGQTLHIPMVEAQEMIDRYYEAYPDVRAYLDRTVEQARKDGYAVTLFGRKRHIPDLASNNVHLRGFAERTAMNHPIQGSAADIIKLAMVQVDEALRSSDSGARMVLQVHDELDFDCPADEVDSLSDTVRGIMQNVVDLKVPLVAEIGTGPNWAEAH